MSKPVRKCRPSRHSLFPKSFACRAIASAALLAASASVSFGQTAYFSTQGDFTAGSSLQDFFITTSRTITSSEVLRFETFSSRGSTPNAAGDTSPTSPTGFDSVLTLTNTFSSGTFTNDDGAAGSNLDSLLSWNGVADSGGTLGTSLSSSLYRLRLNEFLNETGPWGVDLVGPANAMTFGGFASAGGVSVMRSLKFGTDAVADLNAPADLHARFNQTSTTLAITGAFVVGQTGNATYTAGSLPNTSLTVGGETRINRGGDIALSNNSILNANGGYIVDGGRVALSGTSRINVASGTQFIDITNGGRMDVNAGTTFDAPSARLDLGFDGNATQNLLVVVDGVVNTLGGSIAESVGSISRATINGANGRWNMSEDLYVAQQGNGTLEVTTGAKVTNRNAVLGNAAGSSGTVIITGTDSVWTNTGNLALGRSGGGSTGNLTIGSGARLNVGDTSASNTVGGFSFIEDGSTDPTDGGVLSVYAGSTLTNTANAGLSIGRGVGRRGSVLVSGAGATINDNATYLGFQGNGTLTINADGDYIANAAFFATSGGTATVTVDGSGSLLWSKGDLNLGSASFGGAGTVSTTNGGTILVGDAAFAFAGADLVVTDASPIGTAGGVLRVSNGSTLTTNQQGEIGIFSGQAGLVIVTGAGSLWTGATVVYLGNNNDQGSRGELVVENGGRVSGGFVTSDGTGSQFTASSAGRIESIFGFAVSQFGGSNTSATVNGANSTIAVGTLLEVGRSGTATLNIQSAGKVTAANAIVGNLATGVGTINLTGAGSLLDVEGDLTVGTSGSPGGRGTINHGLSTFIRVGDAAGTFTGSRVEVSDSNLAGNAGGNFVFNNGSTMATNAVVTLAGPADTFGRLAVNGNTSSFSTNAAVEVGSQGTGVLDINTGGRVTLNSTGNGTSLLVGLNTPGLGTITVDGIGSVLDVNNSVFLGNPTGNNGTRLSSITVRNNGRLLVGDKTFDPSMMLTGPEGAPPVQVDISDDERDGSEGGLIDIRPGSLLDASDTVGIGSEFGSYGRVNVNGVSGTGGSAVPARMTVGTDLIVARGYTTSAPSPLQTLGTLDINFGGRVTVGQNMFIASDSNARGNVSVTGSAGTIGSTLDVTNTLYVGSQFSAASNSFGSLIIAVGGVVSVGELVINTNNSSVRIDAGGTLLIDTFSYGVLSDVRGYLAAGYNNGNWANVGITSLTAAGNSRLAIGYITANNLLTARVTLKGDTDLNGIVEFPDLLALAQNYTQSSRYWNQGDFDYNGVVEFPDLLVLAQNYNNALLSADLSADPTQSFLADWAHARSLVPEPTTLSLVLGAMSLLGRRRRV